MLSRLRLIFSLLVLVAAFATGCVGPANPTDWEVATDELQTLAEAVDAAGDATALDDDGAMLISISDQVKAGISAKGTMTQLGCASLGNYWRGGQIGAPKKSFAQKLGKFAKGVGLGVVGTAVPGANILSNALGSHLGAGGNFGDTPGLNGEDMMQKMAQFQSLLDSMVHDIKEKGLSPESIGADFFAPGSIGAKGRELLTHELAHVVQQRGTANGATLPADLADAVNFLLEAERLDNEIEAELSEFSAGLTSLNTKLDAFLASDDTCMAATADQLSKLQEATQMESRRFQTLSNASKARHDIAMNAIRNMK